MNPGEISGDMLASGNILLTGILGPWQGVCAWGWRDWESVCVWEGLMEDLCMCPLPPPPPARSHSPGFLPHWLNELPMEDPSFLSGSVVLPICCQAICVAPGFYGFHFCTRHAQADLPFLGHDRHVGPKASFQDELQGPAFPSGRCRASFPHAGSPRTVGTFHLLSKP